MLGFLARRVLFAALTIVLTAFFAYGTIRVLRPELCHTKRALGQAPGRSPTIDIPTLQALALWASVLIVLLGLVADLAIVRLDPRARASGSFLG